MEPDVRDDLLLELFRQLRRGGFALGIAELIAARKALAAGFGATGEEALARTLRLLWCSNAAQNAELEARLRRLFAKSGNTPAQNSPPPSEPEPKPAPTPVPDEPPEQESEPLPSPVAVSGISPLPVRAPETPEPIASQRDLILFDPISRRAMAHSWRYLRRRVKDGPWDCVDLEATVERSARLGWHLGPVLGRRETDHGHLVLLVDQGGSMVPFHRLTRDLMQTAADSALRVDIAYFQNVPRDEVYEDPHRTRRLPLDHLLVGCTPETALLFTSDAGAARGTLNPKRFAETARALVRLKRRSRALAWLNPVPAQRWQRTTAELVGAVVPMFQMDEDGLANAIDVVRGQVLGGAA